MESRNQKIPDQIDENILDDALDGFDDQEKLNLTFEAKEENGI